MSSLLPNQPSSAFSIETSELLKQSVRQLSPYSPSALFGGGSGLQHERVLHRAIWGAVWALGRGMLTMHAGAGGLMCDAANAGLRRIIFSNEAPNNNMPEERTWLQRRFAFALVRTVMICGSGSGCSLTYAELCSIASQMEDSHTGAFAAAFAACRAHKDPEMLMRVASFIAALVPDAEGEADMLAARQSLAEAAAAC